MAVRTRVKELRFVPAGSLIPDPRNWRTHPLAQREALQHLLDRIGFADALITREQDGELIIIDGHLRAEEADPDQELPVLVLDLDEDEAALMLATFDPLGAMAAAEESLLAELLSELNLDEEAFSEVVHTAERPPLSLAAPEPRPQAEPEVDPEPRSPRPAPETSEYVVITFRVSRDQYEEKMSEITEAIALIGIQPSIQNVR